MHNKKRLKWAVSFSRGIVKLPHIHKFLNLDRVTLTAPPKWRQEGSPEAVLGWGYKSNSLKARSYAQKYNLPYYSLEDGFIRSIGLGRQGYPSISLVVDSKGIYYDSRSPSTLEELLNNDDAIFTPEIMETADQARDLIVQHNLTKYNGAPNAPISLFDPVKSKVLIVDQVSGDLSLTFGLPEGFNLNKVVAQAKEENPDSQIYVKLHPEKIAGFRAGLFDAYKKDPSIQYVDADLNSLSILKHMDKVYVATSLMGFEALMLGKQVVCFGMPFYAGWGLTDDRVQCPRRKRKRTVLEVFAAAYIIYSRYVNPQTGKRCDILEALQFLIRELHFDKLNRGDLFCFGIRHWKRYNVLPYLKSSRNRVVFAKTVSEAKRAGIKKGAQIIIWGAREPPGLEELVTLSGKPPLRMEDGFLRSVGLGSDLVRPSSLVLDSEGIYFDPSGPSTLEQILSTTQFSPELLERAARVRKKIIRARLSKYNTEPHLSIDTDAVSGRTLILVPGQVEDDASIRLGCVDIRTNFALLEAVRRNNPNAYIFYKPHPDVVSGNRKGRVETSKAREFCDQVIETVSIAACLDIVDEVHTMTSLVGFEALLRRLTVVVYGKPFYAGWGLTQDRSPISRRTRSLTLDELVAATLLLYPRYYDWQADCWTDCEGAIDSLVLERQEAESATGLNRLQLSFVERQFKKLGLLIKGLVHAW